MKFLLGTKVRMTQLFDAEGVATPCTVLRVAPHTVSAVKTAEKDGYNAVQIVTEDAKKERLTKADLGNGGAYRYKKEFRARESHQESVEGFEKGASFDASIFAQGDTVSVSALSKGKGFQGVVKRHNFRGGPASHGMKHTLRTPGSIGSTGAQRVFKGLRMAGRMGSERVTVKNLRVMAIDAKENIILVSGAVPGRRGTLVEVRSV